MTDNLQRFKRELVELREKALMATDEKLSPEAGDEKVAKDEAAALVKKTAVELSEEKEEASGIPSSAQVPSTRTTMFPFFQTPVVATETKTKVGQQRVQLFATDDSDSDSDSEMDEDDA